MMKINHLIQIKTAIKIVLFNKVLAIVMLIIKIKFMFKNNYNSNQIKFKIFKTINS